MKKIDLSNLSQILFDGITDKGIDKDIRKRVLNNIGKKHYNIACKVFNQAGKEYLELGLKIGKILK